MHHFHLAKVSGEKCEAAVGEIVIRQLAGHRAGIRHTITVVSGRWVVVARAGMVGGASGGKGAVEVLRHEAG